MPMNEMPQVDETYARILDHLLNVNRMREGELRENRTDYKMIEDFGVSFSFDMQQSFPLLQLKKTITKSVIAELIGFIRGYDNVKQFQELGTNIWNQWADKETGDLGPIYGVQWRRAIGLFGEHIDQLQDCIDTIKNNPNDRRIIVNSWDVGSIDRMALPPCHYSFQFHCGRDNTLDLLWNQRSCDVFLGLPFNIASYGILLEIVAKLTGRKAGTLIGNMGNFHLYENQIDGAKEVISRYNEIALEFGTKDQFEPVKIEIDDFDSLESIEPDMIRFKGYNPLPQIKVDVAV